MKPAIRPSPIQAERSILTLRIDAPTTHAQACAPNAGITQTGKDEVSGAAERRYLRPFLGHSWKRKLTDPHHEQNDAEHND